LPHALERLDPSNPPAGPHPERRFVAWYVALAAAWIALSDRLLALLARTPAAFVRGSAVKGCAFVILTGVLGHVVLRRSFARLRSAADRMRSSDRELGRATAALRVLGRCNQALVRAATEAELLDELCRLAVEEGGYRLAWIGLAEHDAARTIRRVAHRGSGEEYLDGLRLTWGDGAAPGWPCAVAIRTRRPCVANDPGSDPAHAAWAERLSGHGFRAVLSVPVVYRDECLGVLGLYARSRDAFDDEAVDRLEQLAGNVAYGLVALRERTLLRESREQARQLAARVQSIREEDRSRIARDLHDDLGPLLTGITVDLRSIERALAQGETGPPARELLERVRSASELATRTVARVQRIATELRPGALDRLGLGPALRQDARRFAQRTGIACDVRLDAELPEASAEVSTALYRIAQEALTNVVRHAEARRVTLRLQGGPGRLVLHVEDDGKGLGAIGAGSPGALGLLGMAERAAMLGGEVRFEPARGGGTRVVASVPLRSPPGGEAP
jgi:signal transduction histidine kinase